MLHLFPDTHFFLHYKHAQEIPWGTVTEADEIRLVTGRAVPKELDKKKFELRGRPQDRARHYVSLLADVAVGKKPGTLREKKPQVTLAVTPGRPAGWTPPADLDPGWFDDVLIADVLAFTHAHPHSEVAVLTGDPGLIAKAMSHGLRVIPLPGRGWELSDEKTPEERELEKLRRENEDLKRTGPAITCALRVDDGTLEAIDLEAVTYPSLEDRTVESLISDLRARHPKATEFPNPAIVGSEASRGRVLDLDDVAGPIEWEAPTSEEVEAYSRAYDRWMDEAASFVREAAASFRAPDIGVAFDIVLHNTGHDPAEGVRLFIETQGGFRISHRDEDDERDESAPAPSPVRQKYRSPPRSPEWKRVVKPAKNPVKHNQIASAVALANLKSPPFHDALSNLENAHRQWTKLGLMGGIYDLPKSILDTIGPVGMASAIHPDWTSLSPSASDFFVPPLPTRPKARDRYRFYPTRTAASEQGTGVGFRCEEFRHRLDAEQFSLRLSASIDGGVPRGGAIQVRLSASNMRQPFERTFPIRIKVKSADVRGLVADLLP